MEQFVQFIESKNRPLFDGNISESNSIKRVGIALHGDYSPIITDFSKCKTENDICQLTHSGIPQIFSGRKYIELTNAAVIETYTNNIKRTFLITRAIRPYDLNVFIEDNSISIRPSEYVSDVLLFEKKSPLQYEYVKALIISKPEIYFFFEDPRISYIYNETNGNIQYFLSGTHYTGNIVMNKYVKLFIDNDGIPMAIENNERSGIPNFMNISPPNVNYVSAKDGMIFMNEQYEIIVKGRYQINFNDPYIRNITNGKYEWKYAEQVFIFKDYKSFQLYDWSFALEDLFHYKSNDDDNRNKPIYTDIYIMDNMIRSNFQNEFVIQNKKGHGPGTLPFIILRLNYNEIYIQDVIGSDIFYVGLIPNEHINDFLINNNDYKFISIDHEIHWMNSIQQRYYDVAIKVFDSTHRNLDFYYSDIIQPKTDLERGILSGIVDLQCIFPMGRIIEGNKQKVTVKLYTGSGDANVGVFEIDVEKLIFEMFIPSSDRWKSGQIYNPNLNQ